MSPHVHLDRLGERAHPEPVAAFEQERGLGQIHLTLTAGIRRSSHGSGSTHTAAGFPPNDQSAHGINFSDRHSHTTTPNELL